MSHRIWLLAMAALFGLGASGCFVDADDDDDVVFLGTYEPCSFTDQCLPEDICLEVTTEFDGRAVTDAICTHECFDDFDCPISVNGLRGACEDVGQGFFCYERCVDDFDCPAGFGCFDTDFNAICLPQ